MKESDFAQPSGNNLFDQFTLAVVDCRALMLRIAQLQLNSVIDAEDVVQDTMLAALKGLQTFKGLSSIRTWLLAILKYKIIDKINSKIHELEMFSCYIFTYEEVEYGKVLSNELMFVSEAFASHLCPIKQLEKKQLFEIIEFCLLSLPEESSRIFLMREYLGLKTSEIATIMQISDSNIRVKLHRSRAVLRECALKRLNWNLDP